jgi:hypothetical protein
LHSRNLSLEKSENLEDPVVESCDLKKLKTNADNVQVGTVDVILKLNSKHSAAKLRKLSKTEKKLEQAGAELCQAQFELGLVKLALDLLPNRLC